jgi:hypothetical protein
MIFLSFLPSSTWPPIQVGKTASLAGAIRGRDGRSWHQDPSRRRFL